MALVPEDAEGGAVVKCQSVEMAIAWLLEAIQKTTYGTVTLSVIIHDHRVQRIERSTIESILIPGDTPRSPNGSC